MSQIFVSDKSKSSKDVLHIIVRRSRYLGSAGGEHESESIPYIAILADLGQPPSFPATFPERDVDD